MVVLGSRNGLGGEIFAYKKGIDYWRQDQLALSEKVTSYAEVILQ